MIPSGRSLFLFDFAQGRYQRWRLADSCRLADTLAGNWSASGNWFTLASPGTSFVPVSAAVGPAGHFFLLDRVGRRLALYDTNAQFLSSLPLPEELSTVHPERLEVHWTRDNLFTFLDLGGGEAWQFAERRTSGGAGQGDWRLVHRMRLPVGISDCLWEPFRHDLCCRLPAGGVRCFDRYFNPADPLVPGVSREISPGFEAWDIHAEASADGGWTVRIGAGGACAEGRRAFSACYRSGQRLLGTCPAEEVPASPAP